MKNRIQMQSDVVSKINTELELLSDEQIITEFIDYIHGALYTFVSHPFGVEKPSCITAVDYILTIASTQKTAEQKEIFKNKWLNFKENISKSARVKKEVLEVKSLLILSALNNEMTSGSEEIISVIKKTLPVKCGEIWKETQDYEDVLSDKEWDRASILGQAYKTSPWHFMES